MLMIKSFKKWYNKCRYFVLLKQTYALPKHKPNRSLLSKLINLLSDIDITEYNTFYGMSIYVDTCDSNMSDLINRLKRINKEILLGKIIPNNCIDKPTTSKLLDLYLSSNNGYYVDINKNILIYIEQCKNLCELMATADTVDIGVEFRNMLLLTNTFTELRNITMVLIEMRLN